MSRKIIKAKVGISAKGFRTAVKDYSEAGVIEELAANSYDADAALVLVLLDTNRNELHIIDDGTGFSRNAIMNAAILGAGEKNELPFSQSKRPFLGCYGFGLKATLKISSIVNIQTVSEEGKFELKLDWNRLEEVLKPRSQGFNVSYEDVKEKASTGTHLTLKLRSPTDRTILDSFSSVLGNLPNDGGKFKSYVGLLNEINQDSSPAFDDYQKLKILAKKIVKTGKITLSDPTTNKDLQNCKIKEGKDRKDKNIKYKIYFTGIRDGKVLPLKKGLRGIYVRIHGRLLKHSFTEQQYVYPISKWVKFAAGLRVEIDVDWLRNEISLSRDDLKFSNPKLKEEFRSLITRVVSHFIQPELKKLEKKSARRSQKLEDQRLELVKKRIQPKKGLTLTNIKSGFNFVPETDCELALLIANPEVLRKINSAYQLVDYNDQAPYDCIFYDHARMEFLKTELEPTLMEFLQHNVLREDLNLIVTWSLGKWRVGAKKKGKRGYFQLIADTGAKKGHYRLLSFKREKSQKPQATYTIIVLEQVLIR